MDENLRFNKELTADIVSAYVSKNSLHHSEMENLLNEVYDCISTMGSGGSRAGKYSPGGNIAIKVSKSVTDDYIVCLEDGKRFKSLKRHLKSKYNMTPHEYRMKWGLTSDYPMVAKNYSLDRSRLARDMGLGIGSNGKHYKKYEVTK